MQLEAQLRLCHSCFWCWKSFMRPLSQSLVHRKAVNYYDLLGVKTDASMDEIKKAFFEKSKKVHPDRDLSNPVLHTQFVELNEAYRVLSKELSRKEYDTKIRHSYGGGQSFRSTSSYTRPGASHMDNMRYWEQLHKAYAQERSEEHFQKKRKQNLKLLGYCILGMFLSIGVHFILFRKLEEVHNNFMNEKDRVITEIYNECKERARVNGFKKQTEILRQKHYEYNNRNNGVDK